jgi:hypothetical protein
LGAASFWQTKQAGDFGRQLFGRIHSESFRREKLLAGSGQHPIGRKKETKAGLTRGREHGFRMADVARLKNIPLLWGQHFYLADAEFGTFGGGASEDNFSKGNHDVFVELLIC